MASFGLAFAELVLLKFSFCSELPLTDGAGLGLVCPRPPPGSTPLAGWWEGWENPGEELSLFLHFEQFGVCIYSLHYLAHIGSLRICSIFRSHARILCGLCCLF